MVRQFAFAAVLVAFSCSAISAADPNAAKYVIRGDASGEESDNLDKAIREYTEAIRRDPKDAKAYLMRGSLWNVKNELDNAIKDCSEAIRLDPKFASAYSNRANAWSQKGELDNAIKDFTEAIRFDPKDANAYNRRGETWSLKGDLDNAIKDHTEAIRLAPKDASACERRGEAWQIKGKLGHAIEDYAEAIRVDPTHAFAAYNNLAWLQTTCPDEHFRDGKKAVANATKACELSAWKSPQCLDTLAAACAEAGDFSNAITWQQKAIEMVPKESDKQVMETYLKLYKAGKPYRDVPKK
jgi:tetratricopeptide (TPR) repeat protein